MKQTQERLGHPFADPELLQRALTHASYAHEHNVTDNERLEWLGDAILQAAASTLLFQALPNASEGRLSRARARIVNTETLADVATQLAIGPDLRLGRGEEHSGGRENRRNLAASVEAVLGAVFLDAGYAAAFDACARWLHQPVNQLIAAAPTSTVAFKDARSRLQEWTQQRFGRAPDYTVVGCEGPSHDPVFTVEVRVDGELKGTGTGRSKQIAKRLAAEAALTVIHQ